MKIKTYCPKFSGFYETMWAFRYGDIEYSLFNEPDRIPEQINDYIIALCCEFQEYVNLAEFQDDYGTDFETIEDIEAATTVIKVDDEAFIVQVF
jgi:hypothetical protein